MKDGVSGFTKIAVIVVAFLMVIYQMVSSQVLLLSSVPYLNLHLLFSLVLVFLAKARDGRSTMLRLWMTFVIVIAILALGYIQLNWQEIQERAYFNTTVDLVAGIIAILLVLEATRLATGWFLSVMAIGAVIYGFVGARLPQPFTIQSMGFEQTMTNLSVGLDTGIYAFLPISANFLFLFILFGGVLSGTGADKFFLTLGRIVMSKVRGGAAMMAVLASCGIGMITGSAAANAAVVGTVTIPLMKRFGFKPEEAGGIEAAASNGGQIMPPIMGMSAFAMAGLTGIPYVTIAKMAILPALIYFGVIGLYVYLIAGKHRLPMAAKEPIDGKELAISSINFLLPILLIVVMMIHGFSVNYIGFWAIVTTVGISLIRKKTRPTFTQFVNGFVSGTVQAAGIGVTTAAVGIILATLTMSGLSVKLVLGIETWSLGSLFLALILVQIITVAMGCAGASITAYMIVSIFAVPALQKMGVPFDIGHFFAMFISVFAFLTPPVALVSLITAKIAEAPYMKTAKESCKAALAGFLVPYIFVYCPVLLLKPKEPIFAIVAVVASMLCLASFQISFVGFLFSDLNLRERGLFFLSAAISLISLVERSFLFAAVGVAIFVAVVLWHRTRASSERVAASGSA
ncbi:MAG TPA: TRAP transporter fused permease subunit [Syntrophorhabdaceae bacterium]|nr:TRAP transporter fused permease subunit [Syntrophorhabdaceae bacterium]HQM81688.1 TRAP transporter fused permease subunit [Syntrophorhabdaceae bacterium]